VSADSLKSKHSDSDGEARLVIDCDDSNRVSPNSKHLKSSQQPNVGSVRITRSKTRSLADVSYVNQTVCQKPVQSNREHEVDNKSFLEDSRTDTKEYTLCSEVTNKMCEDSVVPEDGHRGECSAVDAEERERQTREVGFTPLGPGFNVSYRRWKLRKAEANADDWKEGFLKGDHSNREIKVLVRCKVDGCEVNV
jgi:hypothetical protein